MGGSCGLAADYFFGEHGDALRRDGRHQSEPGRADLPMQFKVAALAAGFAGIARSLRRARCLRRDCAPAFVALLVRASEVESKVHGTFP